MAATFSSNRIDFTSWTNLSPVSVCFWFYINPAIKDPERMFGSDDVWEIRVTTGWSPGSYRFSNELFGDTACISTTVISASVWYHGVCTAVSGTSRGVYINGISEATAGAAATPTGTTLSIGNRSGSAAGDGLSGIIDDVRIYNRILTADEIATIYACRGSDTILNGLQNRWLLNEGGSGVTMTGTGSVKDLTGTKDGTPASSPTYTESFIKLSRQLTRK